MTSRSSGGGAAVAVADVADGEADGTPVRRRLGTSTDDAAIFFEDTVDRVTAQCIDASPSALALLTPQRMPTGQAAHVDMTEYDASHLGSLSVTKHRSSGGENSGHAGYNNISGGSGSNKGRFSGPRSALHDMTNTSSVKLNASAGSKSKSPTPKPARSSTSRAGHSHGHHGGSHNSSLMRSTPRHGGHDRSPSAPSPAAAAAEPTVLLRDFEALQKERNRFEKMYEHQRALYEEMAEKQAETYQALQDKIIEVVALSTRNEESKRFIRQLKREFSESRTRVMDMQNKALEEARAERNTKSRYEALLHEQECKYDRLVERHETKLAGMESLVKDLTCLRGDQDQLHVSQLDSLLKAAYAKSTALFSDLLKQGRQIDLLYDAKGDLENQLEQLRREKREMESTMREERRRMVSETERLIEQVEEQQQSILNLRQMLIRTMDNRDNVFAYSRGPRQAARHGDHDRSDEEAESEEGSQTSGSFSSSSSPSSIAEEGEEDRSLSEGNFDVDDNTLLHREIPRNDVREQGEEEQAEYTNPLFVSASSSAAAGAAAAAMTSRPSRGRQSRPIISASATAPALTSNNVVVSRRGGTPTSVATTNTTSFKSAKGMETPPSLPLSSRGASTAATSTLEPSPAASACSFNRMCSEQPYRIPRSADDGSSGARPSGRVENDENFDRKTKGKALSGVPPIVHTREKRDAARSNSSNSTHNNGGGSPRSDGGDDSSRERPSQPSSSSSSSLSSALAGSGLRRHLDFTTALAAVTEKRRRDRMAREESTDMPITMKNSIPTNRSPAEKNNGAEVNKENSNVTVSGRHVLVRSGTADSIAAARASSGVEKEEEEEEEPRLFPRASLCPRQQ